MKLSALLRSQLQYNACEFDFKSLLWCTCSLIFIQFHSIEYYCNMYVHVHKRYVDGHIISLFIFFLSLSWKNKCSYSSMPVGTFCKTFDWQCNFKVFLLGVLYLWRWKFDTLLMIVKLAINLIFNLKWVFLIAYHLFVHLSICLSICKLITFSSLGHFQPNLASLGEEDSCLFKRRAMPFTQGR